MKKKLFFPKRIPEPKIMGEVEMRAFEKLSTQNYKRWLIPLVDDVLANNKKQNSMAILDVGCGPGLLVKEFALRSQSFFMTGVDISRVAIRMAKKNCKGLPNVYFAVGNVNKLPFQNNSFDAVVCKDTFHHFNNPKRGLKEALRVTKIGGMIYIQDLRRDVPQYLFNRVMPQKTMVEKLIYYSTRAAYTKGEMEKLFRDMKILNYKIRTRVVTARLRRRYAKQGIDTSLLKEGFVSRYAAIIKKQKSTIKNDRQVL